MSSDKDDMATTDGEFAATHDTQHCDSDSSDNDDPGAASAHQSPPHSPSSGGSSPGSPLHLPLGASTSRRGDHPTPLCVSVPDPTKLCGRM